METQHPVKCHVIAVITASFQWVWQARESVQGAERRACLSPQPRSPWALSPHDQVPTQINDLSALSQFLLHFTDAESLLTLTANLNRLHWSSWPCLGHLRRQTCSPYNPWVRWDLGFLSEAKTQSPADLKILLIVAEAEHFAEASRSSNAGRDCFL